MTMKTKVLKGLLCATALTAFSTGTAYAQVAQTQNDYTAANELVSNTFELNYEVGGVTQPPITPPTPTTFRVDRLVNVVVTAGNDDQVSPGEENAFIDYSVFNAGNDDQAYQLTVLEDNTDFTLGAPTNTTPLVYFVDTNNNGILDGTEGDAANAIPYNPATPPVLAPDETIIVRVYRDIPDATTAADGETNPVTLVAATLDSTSPFALTTEDTDGNDIDATENVFADGNSTAAEGTDDGADSAVADFVVVAADVSANKTVEIITQDGSGCANFATTAVAGAYAVPGACVEYVIAVENDGTADATAITISDTLGIELEFVESQLAGALSGTLTDVASGTDCDATPCLVSLASGTLVGDGGGAATTGSIVIRALIK